MLNPVLHLTEIKVLKLLDTYPQNEGYIAPDDIISLYFDKRIIENSVKNDPSKLRLQLASGGPLITCTITVTGSEIKIKRKVKLTEKYNYKLFISKDILASDGSSLTEDKEIAFSVKSKDGQGPKQEEHDENNNQNDINKPGDEQPDTNDDLPIMADLEQHWAKEYVNKLVAKGVVNGIKQEDGSFLFYPDNQISRQEFAKMIISSSNHSLAEPKDLPFADNALIADWAKPYVSAAYQLGLIKGVKEENGLYFYPDKSNHTR